MMLRMSRDAQDALVQVIPALIDSGTGKGTIEIMTGSRTLLAKLSFSKPSANAPESGSISFKPIAEDSSARAGGKAAIARIQNSDGELVFECDVSDEKGDGVIRLNTTDIHAGGPVRITSFELKTATESEI